MLFALLSLPLRLFGAGAAAPAAQCSDKTFFGLEPWYHYLTLKPDSVTGGCSITNFNGGAKSVLGAHSPFLLIGLAVIDDLLRIAGLAAIGFVIYGGIQYTTSQGSPDQTAKAQQTIINALVGVAISVVAVALVGFLGNKLGGTS
ncbi:MAG TPA: hypothetical protein VG992_04400 [Candidatus Saccharimonadales bacterium]|nr:hypothetical protein [Candidatus Saccharimonadales bacterium]